MSVTVDKCLQAWTNSLKQMNAKADIVFFGDSLTFYGDFTSVFPDKVVCNLGLRGDTICGMISRVEQVKMLAPKHVFLMAGINDISSCSVDVFSQQYKDLVLSLLQLESTEVIIQSLTPVNDYDFKISCNNIQIMACNEVIKSLSKRYHLCYLDLFSLLENNHVLLKEYTLDGIHLTSMGYEKWLDYLTKLNLSKDGKKNFNI